ncbi:MAG: toll/interleukin-1 receptor domain-containing protein [Chloroflexi bacterium]|nr:toll/interleukin-1 receptor domain-containing protein [Chloroflexota bacterium]
MTTSDRSILVFLSYAHEDKPIINELFERLSKEDWIIPWLDERSLLAGQNWPDVIEESVEKSDAVIVFLSNQSVNKNGFVQREVRYA